MILADDKVTRYRFSVPLGDNVVNDWVDAQSNLSFSLRLLIRAFVRSYGMQDVTCLELGLTAKKRGRPLKQNSILINNVMEDTDNLFTNNRSEPTDMLFEQNADSVPDEAPVVQKESAGEADIVDKVVEPPSKQFDQEKASTQVKPVSESKIGNSGEDDDGFVDPMSLLN